MRTPMQFPAAPNARRAPRSPAGTVYENEEEQVTPPARDTVNPRPYPYPEDALQRELDEKFALYETLGPGWDMYSADPTNTDSLADARKFLENRPVGVPLPFPQIDTDGVVGIYWETDRMHVSVGFEGNGLLSYYIRQVVREGRPLELLADGLPYKEGWPPKLLEKLWEL